MSFAVFLYYESVIISNLQRKKKENQVKYKVKVTYFKAWHPTWYLSK